jgi:hypothetical protein
MTVTVANTANTSTFNYWLNRTNELAHAMTTKAVTVESNAAVGNAQIIGTFTANTLLAGSISITNDTTVVRVIANSAVGNNGQVLTSNGNGSYWRTLTASVNSIATANGIIGGPITTNGTIQLDLYTGDSENNLNYPVGTVVSVYMGSTSKLVSSTDTIYTGNLKGLAGVTGDPLVGTWRNRGLCGKDSANNYYLYQRVV